MDWRNSVAVDYYGVTYYVRIKIYGVYNGNGTPISDCNSSSATPAHFYNTWICASNDGYPYYQNWDACANRATKLMLYCWPVQGCIDVTGTGGNQFIATFLDTYLDTFSNMLRPATSAPRLGPPYEAAQHVYAKRPTVDEYGQNCPNYNQPYGCP
jgi:hypothetical protein